MKVVENETQRFFDYMKKHNIPLNILKEHEGGFFYNTNKKAVTSWGSAREFTYPAYNLLECEVCGKRGGGRHIKYRSELHMIRACNQDYVDMFGTIPERYIDEWWMDKSESGYREDIPKFIMKVTMCWGCYNKIKPTIKKIRELMAMSKFLRKNKQEISYEKLNKNN